MDCENDPYIPDPKPDCNKESTQYPNCIKPLPPYVCKNGSPIYPKCKGWNGECKEGSPKWPGCDDT